jgi:hypothetical protein
MSGYGLNNFKVARFNLQCPVLYCFLTRGLTKRRRLMIFNPHLPNLMVESDSVSLQIGPNIIGNDK